MTNRADHTWGARTALPEGIPIHVPLLRLRRWLFFGLIAGTTAVGSWMMLGIVHAAGISALEVVILALFVPTFGWISVAFWNSLFGFMLQILRRDPLTLMRVPPSGTSGRPIRSRTALVMPAHNEDPERVMSGLAATLRSIARTEQDQWFDTFLLSDTTDPAIIEQEECAWEGLRSQMDHPERLRYRRRPENSGRKSGNLADFCERWGDEYEFMVVLDADSIMSGDALVELVQTMEKNPRAGLLQTVPLPARQDTLFGRLLQFAACLYSPLLATGQSFWQGDAANYWGHNAVVRLRAFREQCRLPVLPGSPPLGGEVLSHDFVEAALLRRAGWHVYLLPWIGGSFEELPGNILDYARRDRRWTQGSLQHLALVSTPGLHPLSRVHFVMGAMGYVSSVLWLLMLLAGTVYVTLAEAGAAPFITGGYPFLSDWSGEIAGPPLSLLAVTAALLFLPKGLGLTIGLVQHRKRFGGAGRLFVSILMETAFAVVLAPVLMIYHTRFVGSVLGGRDVAWDGRTRGGSCVSWGTAAKETAGITVVGLAWGALTLYSSWAFLLWLTPIFAGLLLAAPLVRWTSSRELGERARAAGLFLVASETDHSHLTQGAVPVLVPKLSVARGVYPEPGRTRKGWS